jgi:putative transposase
MAKTQVLSYPVRLPDVLQADALRLLHASRDAINAMLTMLWPQLDEFAGERAGPAWKQVDALLIQRPGHGSRQERCEMEQAGRILRAQASRKQTFLALLPLLTSGLIMPATDTRPAYKDRKAIAEQIRQLRGDMEEPENFIALRNLLEQACNLFLRTGTFPDTYEALQPVPLLETAQLTYAGDDGMTMGQAYQIRKETTGSPETGGTSVRWFLKLRYPTAEGKWQWHPTEVELVLPVCVLERLRQGANPQAPTLREITDDAGNPVAVLDVIVETPAVYVSPLEHETRVVGFDWGVRTLVTISVLEKSPSKNTPYQQVSRPFFLDTGGIDGRQARLRREIDRLKACSAKYQTLLTKAAKAWDEEKIPFPGDFSLWQGKRKAFERQIAQCWKTYERRNRELAHLASNVLILIALLHGSKLICGEDLTTLRTVGHGRDTKGKWRNWRNNSQVRGELWRILSYKCFLFGLRARQVHPKDTSHTCPHCGKPAKTYRSPSQQDRQKAVNWGAWLCCAHPDCQWSGSRDYAASLNIARLGMAMLETYQTTKRYQAYRMTSSEVKPVSYMGTGSTLLLPSSGLPVRPREGKHVYYAGWSSTASVRTSHPIAVLGVMSTAVCRKFYLRQTHLIA